MKKEGIIVIDVGTSKIHANLIDLLEGKLISSAVREYEWAKPHEGWVEINPDEIWEKAQLACKDISGEFANTKPVALTFSWFGANLVVMNEKGEALYPLIVSFDARADKESLVLQKKIKMERQALVGRGGLDSTAIPAKLLWMKNHIPDTFRRIRYIGTIQQFFLLKMNFPICGDESLMATLQFQTPNGKWMEDIIDAVGITMDKIGYPILKGEKQIGISNRFGNVDLGDTIPIFLGGHDCILSQLGAGISFDSNSMLGDVAGTYDLMGFFINKEKVSENDNNVIATPISTVWAYLRGMPCGAHLNCEVEKLFGRCDSQLIGDLFSKTTFGCEEKSLLEYEEWEKIKESNYVYGQYDKYNIFQSIVEELTFELKECFDSLVELNKKKFTTLRVGGGAAKSGEWLELKANVFDVEVEQIANNEISSMGAAIIAAVSLGKFKTYKDAISNLIHIGKRFSPDLQQKTNYKIKYEKWKRKRLSD